MSRTILFFSPSVTRRRFHHHILHLISISAHWYYIIGILRIIVLYYTAS